MGKIINFPELRSMNDDGFSKTFLELVSLDYQSNTIVSFWYYQGGLIVAMIEIDNLLFYYIYDDEHNLFFLEAEVDLDEDSDFCQIANNTIKTICKSFGVKDEGKQLFTGFFDENT